MGLLSEIGRFFSGPVASGGSVRRLVLDGHRMAGSGSRGPSPRDQLAFLRRAGQFALRENLEVVVVFNSEALRRVASGEVFEGAKVLFAEGDAAYEKALFQAARSGGRSTALVTPDAAVEKKAPGTVLRASTLNKAWNSGGGGGSSNGVERRGRRPSARRSNGNRSEPRKPRPEPRQEESDGGVDSFIDVV